MSNISTRFREIEDDRRKEMQRLMQEYDKTVYYPAIKQLREECGIEGHVHGQFHDNGLGWVWWYCKKCGTSFDHVNHNESK